MATGVVLIHFGEPERADPEAVERYLTRIFLQNADLEGPDSPSAARERARELARRRAPALLEEYEAIGGSPLNAQAHAQAERLAETLTGRGHEVTIRVAFQFVDPTIADVLESFRAEGIDRLIAVPVYPLCGPSTTVAALEEVDRVIAELSWDPRVTQVSGWHRHPGYLRMRAANLRAFLRERSLDPNDAGTVLLCSAHGTPMTYVEAGSRYVAYVEEACRAVATLAGIEEFELGYQNHENRDIPWTTPDVDRAIADLDAAAVVVEPVSFMHEQSETLSELDIDLAAAAERAGMAFHRVPIPHADDTFPTVLGDVIEPALVGIDPAMFQLRPCACKPGRDVYCLNAPR